MKSTTVYLVQLPEPVREMAVRAAREVFPRAQLVPAQSVDDAVRLPGQERQLLVVGEIGEAGLGMAAQTMTANELPRWAVVHIGENSSDLVETVPPGECSVRLLARIFRSSLLNHELLQENLQLRGDLRTLARRFNHDLRTPLGCINAACALFNEAAGAGQAQHSAEALAAIRSALAEMDSLLERVSLVLKSSSEPLLTAPLAMGPIVQRVVRQLTSAPERHEVKIRQPALWPDVRGVEKGIEFVWTNLIHNALRHGVRGGTIQLGWESKGAEARFWVSSAGAVPLALQPNLLRPFHLLHHRPSAGLGLSLVERIVALHGGRCGYESTPDNRALFHFTLPAIPASTHLAVTARSLSTTGRQIP
jgi:signal transduction histidine kinase